VGGRKGDGYISPGEQRDGITARASELDATIPEDGWFFDEDYTGGNFRRPEWERLLRRIETGDLAGVICVRVDRFARNVAEGATMIARIEKAGGMFAAVDVPMDTRTPTGRYMLNQFLNNAEFQLNLLKASWIRAKQRAIARGAHIGKTPTGMGRVPKNAESRAGCLFPLDDWRAPLVAIFQYAASVPSDVSTTVIAHWANGRARRPDGRLWTPTSIGHVLSNRVYIGEISYRPRPNAEVQFTPLVNRHAHEPMVDEATFLAAQRTTSPRQDTRLSRSSRVSILQGLVRCCGCRHTMPPSMAGGSLETDPVDVYRCVGKFSSGVCAERPSIVSRNLETWVVDQVKAQFVMDESFAPVVDDRRDEITAAQQEATAAAATLDAIEKNVALAANQPTSWANAVAEARKLLTEAQERLAELISASKLVSLTPAKLDWDSITRQELRDEILPAKIDCIMVRKGRGLMVHERAIILWRGQAPHDLPGKGRPAPSITPWDWPVSLAA
jgi:hypothetical protein